MLLLLMPFFVSFLTAFFILRYQSLHQHFSHDHNLDGPQKVHKTSVPRIGGLCIVIGLISALIAPPIENGINLPLLSTFLLCSIPTYAIGFCEDVTKVIGIKMRLLFTAISAGLIVYCLEMQITHLNIHIIDLIFVIPFFGFTLSIFAITGLANAYNIIDGFNGLASMVAIITLISISYVCYRVGDLELITLCLILITSILGFFIWNYPRGLIFLGDGGAYLIGFWIASISVFLIFRHHDISPWFALLVNGYPTTETLFTIYRRKFHQNKNPGLPDGIHFHSLIYRRILRKDCIEHTYKRNAKAAKYLWALSSLSAVGAGLFWDKTKKLMLISLIFILIYCWLYRSIVRFKSPSWLG